ncbi:MAG: S-layer homology domain-containing protein [Eubacteriales bacterium]|nr:S-layer homology domain-containing protein [Eubacteriales bacterium]
MKVNVGKQLTAFMMAAVMTFTTVQVNALAVETTESGTDGLCEHHPAHTAACGYKEGTPGMPCTHEHDEDCYTLVTECVHAHTEECYPEENASDDTATSSEPEDAGPTECTHECSEESGCITEELDCEHEHDEVCGYAPAEPGSPCTFVCGECGQTEEQADGQIDEQEDTQADGQTDGQREGQEDEQIEAVQAQIDAIPDTDELSEMTAEEQQAEYEKIQAAFDAYNALTDEQKSKITGAEVFDSLFAFFDGMTNALAVTGPVKYLAENGDDKWVYSYTKIDTSLRDTLWSDDKYDGWYVINDRNTEISGEITVSGEVHLVLTDDHRLLARRGIRIEENSSLTVYCQERESGVLSIKGYSTTSDDNKGVAGGAAISIGDGGTLTINGGTVSTVGGNGNEGSFGNGDGGDGGAGISGVNGTIIMNGGALTANGGTGGYGGSSSSDNGGRGGDGGAGIIIESIMINEGAVEVQVEGGNGGEGGTDLRNGSKNGPGGNGAAGISGTFTIEDGSVTVQGGTGGSGKGNGTDAPGISISEGEALTVSGGTVSATGGGNGAGISVGDGGMLTVGGGKVTAIGRIGISTGAAAITISDGSVTATGNNAGTGVAGSSGISIGDGGNLTIEGGKVTATGGDGGKGNDVFGSGGPGENGGTGISVSANGSITITDGSLTATGGKGGAGNSGNKRAGRGGNGGAGISISDSGSININGGTVKAIGNNGGNGAGAENKDGDGGNGGAGIVSENEGVTVTGGIVTATGGAGGRGISGWGNANGGNGGAGIVSGNGGTAITSGAVTATGGSGGYGFNNGNIGSGGTGVGGAFSTGSHGNAMIKASSIDDNEDKSSWRGIIFDGNSGGVYGKQKLQENLEISDSQELTIPESSTLEIPKDVTLIIDGKLTNNGHIIGDGTLTGSGTLTGNGTIADTIDNDFIRDSLVTVGFEGEGVAENTVIYGSFLTIQAMVEQRVNTLSLRQNTVDFYQGDPNSNGRKLNEDPIPVVNNTAMLENVEITGDAWALNTYTIYAVYDGGMTLQPQTGSADLSVKGNLGTADVKVNGTYAYTGSQITPDVSIMWNETRLTDGTDYELSYVNSNGGEGDLISAGTVTVTATGTGNYTGTKTASFTIEQSETAFEGGVTVDREDRTYTYGDPITVSVTPKATGVAAVRNSLALLTEPAAPEAGQMAIYEGDRQLTEAQDVTNGAALIFKLDTVELGLGSGVHELTAKFVGSDDMAAQSGTVEVKIEPAPLSDAEVAVSGGPFIYDGNAKTPTVNVAWKKIMLINGTDYELSYENINGGAGNLTNAGTVTVTATGTGNYTGTQITAFTIGKAEAPAIVWPVADTIIYGQKLSESKLSGGSTEYGSFAWEMPDTVPPVLNDGYMVVFKPGEATEQNYETISTTKQVVAVPVEKAAPELTLTPSATEQKGRGQVEFKLTGLPEGGKAEFICSDSSITLETGEANIWKAMLPNISQTYSFTAAYSGDDNHEAAEASCQVVVTRRNASGGGSGTVSDPSTVLQPDQGDSQIPTTGQTTPVLPGTDGSAVIDGGVVQDTINHAAADAVKNGNAANGIAVTVPIQNAQGVKSLSVIIKAGTLDMLVAAEVRRFEIMTNALPSLGFTLDTLKMLDTRSEGGDLILRMSQAAVTSDAARAAVGTRPVYEISLVYVSDGREMPLTDWQGRTVSVKLPYTTAANEQTGSLYAVSVDGSGKVQWIIKSAYDAGQKAVIFEAGQFGICGIGYKSPVPVFTDIDSHWAKDDILFTVSRGLFSGTGETTFSPDAGLTRAMLVTALGRLTGIDPAAYQSGTFADVKADADYAAYVNWAAATGIASGMTSATFEPDGIITREQMAVIMKSYADKLGYSIPKMLKAVTYLDNAEISFWAKDAVKAMQQAGILSGKDSLFDPQGGMTRAEAAAALHRFVEVIIDPQTVYGWMQNDNQDN